MSDMRTLHVTRTANSNLQNRINISIIFNYVREHGPMYRAQIAKDLGLSAPAVSRAIENLIEEGYLIETEKIRTESGKKAARVIVNSDKGFVVGVDLMKEPIRIAVSNFNGEILSEFDCFNMTDEIDLESELIGEIRRIVKLQKNPRDLKAICIGIPAIVDGDGSVTSAILYANLEGKNLKQSLEKAFKVAVFAENDANLSALAECEYGAGRDSRSFVFVEVGNGVGAGIILDRNLYRGFRGAAGEIGFSLLDSTGIGRRPKRKGHFEDRASIDSIRQRATAAATKGQRSILLSMAQGKSADISPALVCQAAVAGDKSCRAILREAVDLLSAMILDIVLILDPERIVLGGELFHLPEAESLFVDPIRETLSKAVPFDIPQIVLSTLHENAVVVGASHMAIESLLVGVYPYKIEPVSAPRELLSTR